MIRQVYLDFLKKRGSIWFMRQALRYIAIQAGWRMGHRPLTGPALGTLMVTYRCNLHCNMCDMPLLSAKEDQQGRQEFDTAAMKKIIGEFASLGTPGVGITGGEPLLRDDIFDLIAAVHSKGMISHLNTNGLLLTPEIARELIIAGTDSVNVSLDGPAPHVHDVIRNCTGAFEGAVDGLHYLVEERARTSAALRIKSVTVISPETVTIMPDMVALAAELGIDCVEFIPRQPFTQRSYQNSPTRMNPHIPPDEWCDLVNTTRQMARKLGIIIENSLTHFNLFPSSFAGSFSPVRCSAAYNSLAIDCYGNIFPCVPWINWQQYIGNIDEWDGLNDFWYSVKREELRQRVGTCRNCYLNCQTELNLLFAPIVR